jgi:CDP-diacylglycerol--glycerol-3-phosphate 3-phosphatidyltransferase
MTIPNMLTGLRLLLVPVFLALIIHDTPGSHQAAVAVFVAASLTDWLDGFVARRAGQVSEFGKVADPLADRLLIFAGVLGLAIVEPKLRWVVPVLVLRDVVLLWGFQYLAVRGKRVAVTWPGKVTTAVLLAAFALLLLGLPFGLPLLYAGVALSVATCIHYVAIASRMLEGSRERPVSP